MKRFKNNKGVTGIDISVSISLIVIILGIVMAMYTSYANKTKEIKRNSTATNLAMKVIEKIEKIDINTIENSLEIKNNTDEEIKQKYGLNGENIGAYIINIKKIPPSNTILQNIAFQVDVTVSYKVGNEDKKVTLSTIKKHNDIGEAQEPDIINIPGGCVPVKYDSAKNGYVKTNEKDSEWYSISSKRFAIVANAGSDGFDINGVIQQPNSCVFYVWIPSYSKDGNTYRFITKDGEDYYNIEYSNVEVDGNDMYYYKKGDEVSDAAEINAGRWLEVTVDSNSNLYSSDDDYQAIINNVFTW